MLHSTTTAGAKRRALRAALAGSRAMQIPGAFSPLAARLVEHKGFDGVYVSGAVVSADLGLPDIGLTTLTEVASRSEQIARSTSLPVIADVDTGFGEPINAARTVQIMEDAGVAAIQIEDQVNPKRCGHLDGKAIVDTTMAVQRVRAAVAARRDPDVAIVARTDARAIDGIDAAVERSRRYADAGADIIFPEALTSLGEYEAVRAAVDLPILANMTEFGKTELFTVEQLESVGVDLIIHPVSLMRVAMGAAERALDTLRSEGSLETEVPQMQTRVRLYELLDYDSYAEFDDGIAGWADGL